MNIQKKEIKNELVIFLLFGKSDINVQITMFFLIFLMYLYETIQKTKPYPNIFAY